MTLFNFGFYANFATNLTYFYQNYGSLLQQIANSVSAPNINAITINSIYVGSPNINFQQSFTSHMQIGSESVTQTQPSGPVNINGAVSTQA